MLVTARERNSNEWQKRFSKKKKDDTFIPLVESLHQEIWDLQLLLWKRAKSEDCNQFERNYLEERAALNKPLMDSLDDLASGKEARLGANLNSELAALKTWLDKNREGVTEVANKYKDMADVAQMPNKFGQLLAQAEDVKLCQWANNVGKAASAYVSF